MNRPPNSLPTWIESARETPFSDDAWDKLLKHIAENAPDAPAGLRRSA